MKKDIDFTYCNPLSIPDIPQGKDDWYAYEKEMFSHNNKPESVTGADYRSISDPTVLYYDNKWYLYPSYGMAWVSEDFKEWKHIKTEPYCPKYSPAIIKYKDGFLMTSWNCPLYFSKSPLGPFEKLGEFILPDGKQFVPCDPDLFLDDDGRIYLHAFDFTGEFGEKDYACKIVGYELDKDSPQNIIRGPVTLFDMNPEKNEWERQGYYHQNKRFGWVEGPHMLKYNGRYYLIYAAPDTCDSAYCMAVYYSDKSPLDDFVCQKRNPLTQSRYGLISGAGHGCVERGPDNTLWAFYTISTPSTHRYERRIGMDLVAVDENGELYCPHGVTSTPQFIPGYKKDADVDNSPRLLSLTSKLIPSCSSEINGRNAIYATDESSITWWQPKSDDYNPYILCDLQAEFLVSAVRIFWHEEGIDYQKNIIPQPVKYLLEGLYENEWFVLVDCSNSTREVNIDYKTFDSKICKKVRLTILNKTDDIRIGVIDFSVFGKMEDR